MPDRSLDSLSTEFYPLACEALARILARQIPVLIVQTGRTQAEQDSYLASGASGTTFSLHLPRRLRPKTLVGFSAIFPERDLDKADAIDIVPYDQFQLHGPDKLRWDATDPAWGIIGEEMERVGLRWGGRWRTPFDPGHGELLLPIKAGLVAAERARPWPEFRPHA